MARDPRYIPSVDTLTATTLRDYEIARSQIVRRIDRRQWAMLTGFGGPGHVASADMTHSGTGSTAHNACVRVPPGVTAMQVGVLANGWGTVTLDAGLTGAPVLDVADYEEHQGGKWIYAGFDESHATLPALSVLSAADDVWTNVDVTVTLASDTGEEVNVYAIAWLPVHAEGVTWP